MFEFMETTAGNPIICRISRGTAGQGGHLARTIGLARAKVKIGLINLVYNMRRLVQLLERDAKAPARMLSAPHG